MPGKSLQSSGVLRADLQVVFQYYRLAVEHKEAKGGVGFQGREHGIDGVHQLHTELLEGEIPLSIPVGVGYYQQF